jgi:hypothetical protein
VIGSLLLLAAAAGCSGSPATRGSVAHPSAVRAPLPQVVDDCEHFALRPTQISVACGDGNFLLVAARYEAWTDAGARGHAMASRNTCVPSCADGRFVDTPVDFALDGRELVYGVPVFTRLVVRDARSGAELLTAPLLPIACTVRPVSCPPSPAS